MSFEPVRGVRAPAKVNLGLEVLGRRDDGYHELRTVLQTIDYHDELSFEPSDRGIELVSSDPSLPSVEHNLVYRAAVRLAESSGCREGARIHLEKKLPVGAGLGGGSSNAAAALTTLNRLWRLGASRSDLHELASGLGMDVPFFLYGGTVLAVGRGDELYPLAARVGVPIVLILPNFSISTSDVYRNLRLTKKRSGRTLQHFVWSHPGSYVGLEELVNDLEVATGEHSDSIQEFKKLLLEQGAAASLMSGSGSAVFGIFQNEASARKASRSLGRAGIRTVVTKTLGGRVSLGGEG